MNRFRLGFALVALGLAAPMSAWAAQTSAPESNSSARPTTRNSDDGSQRLREGSRLNDVLGHFDYAGDRFAFFPAESKESFRMLESLALERVTRVLGESRVKPRWIISGVITEYRGINYLLITKAVMETAANERAMP